MKNKKGISAIVATVLIILITVAAVTIIWAAIIPMISNELGGATECFDASASLSVITDYSCYEEGENVTIQVSRTTGEFTLVGLDVTGYSGGNSETLKITGVNDLPSPNGAKVYKIGLGGVTASCGADGTAACDGNFTFDSVDSASVAAVVESGQTSKTCEGSAVITIPKCTA